MNSPITAADSVPPWERDRSKVRPPDFEERHTAPWTPRKVRTPVPKVERAFEPVNYHDYMQSAKWCRKRRKALKRAGHKCEECTSTDRLEVHHLNYKRLGREHPEDLKVLCYGCHQPKHEKKYPLRDSLSIEFRQIAKGFQ